MSSGRVRRSCGPASPSFSAAAGRKFCTTTSAVSMSRAATARPAAVVRSITTERLLRFTLAKKALMPFRDVPRPRRLSPCGGSTFRTGARTVTETDLVNFLTLFGFNEPLFWDARHGAEAGYTGRLVPGALTYCLAEGLVIQTGCLHDTGLAFLHMDLDVRRPVFVG